MDLTEEFVALRSSLLATAYHIVGSRMDAEDVVQSAWEKWSQLDPETVRDPRALLTVIVSRLALNAARAQARRRESYVGPWLPEPVTDLTPEWTVLQRDGLGHALDTLLATLTPEQATAFVLRELLDLDYAEIAAIIECSPAAARQHVSRGRRRAQAAFASPKEELNARGERALSALVTAVTGGDVASVATLLAADSVLFADGGGKARSALRPVHGAEAIARFLLGVAQKAAPEMRVESATINGGPGVIVVESGIVTLTVTLRILADTITELYLVRNPDKLARIVI